LGLVLILLPTDSREKESASAPATESPETADPATAVPQFSLDEEEKRLETTLSSIAGVGEVKVLLSLKSTAERELAQGGEDGTLVISTGGGTENAVDLYYRYPAYLGAVVVCRGADNAAVRLKIVEAVSVFTGLGTDKISVSKMK
jgi:stage III sporulation protein AG